MYMVISGKTFTISVCLGGFFFLAVNIDFLWFKKCQAYMQHQYCLIHL